MKLKKIFWKALKLWKKSDLIWRFSVNFRPNSIPPYSLWLSPNLTHNSPFFPYLPMSLLPTSIFLHHPPPSFSQKSSPLASYVFLAQNFRPNSSITIFSPTLLNSYPLLTLFSLSTDVSPLYLHLPAPLTPSFSQKSTPLTSDIFFGQILPKISPPSPKLPKS